MPPDFSSKFSYLYSVMVFPSKSSNFDDRLPQDAAHRWLFCLYTALVQPLMSNQQPDYNYDDSQPKQDKYADFRGPYIAPTDYIQLGLILIFPYTDNVTS